MYSLRLRLGRGFTLIELLIVITIIGILAVALVPRITGAPAAARDAARKSNINQISVAMEQYLNDNGGYPHDTDNIDPNDTAGNDGAAICLLTDPATSPITDDIKDYMGGSVPKDPQSSKPLKYFSDVNCIGADQGSYLYVVLTNGSAAAGYLVGAILEGKAGNDSDCIDPASASTTCNSTTQVADMADQPSGDRPYYLRYNVL